MVVLVTGMERLEAGDDFGIDDGVFFDPADFPFGGFDLEESMAMLEDFEAVSILDHGDAVRNSGDAVAEEGLLEENIDDFGWLLMLEAAAAGERKQQ